MTGARPSASDLAALCLFALGGLVAAGGVAVPFASAEPPAAVAPNSVEPNAAAAGDRLPVPSQPSFPSPAASPAGAATETAPAVSAAEAAFWAGYEARWSQTRDYRADFDQVVELVDIGSRVESAGRFEFAKPDRLRWDYTAGDQQTVVGDGATVWLYQPDLEQVYEIDYRDAFGSGGLIALLGGREALLAAYRPTVTDAGGSLVRLDLEPLDAAKPKLVVTVVRESFDIDTVELVEPTGAVTRMRFRAQTRNGGIDPSRFVFTPPPGVDIIRGPAGAF